MANPTVSTVVHLCEDTSQTYTLISLLQAGGYDIGKSKFQVQSMNVLGANGLPDTTVPAGLLTKGDTAHAR